ncbi:MAG: transcriptional repressor LexA [Clostridia bacterium]|nr:transcriptional repressor LexA [Clostridia bacterium]
MSKIDKKLNDLYEYVNGFSDANGYPPTVRDICKDLSIKSTATAHYYLEKLKERGLIIKREDKKRAITVSGKKNNSFQVPLIGTVTAGSPIFAVENFEDYYPLPLEFKSEEDVFMLKVQGESMINAGIFDGDKIIVKRQESADNGEIVVALIDDSATVKRLFKKNGKIVLHPENDFMEDIVLDEVKILGVVTGLTRKF